MADIKPFKPVKLICGIIASEQRVFARARKDMENECGFVDHASDFYAFGYTDYYEKQMGPGLKRQFLSFHELIKPEHLSRFKMRTNKIEEIIRVESKAKHRLVNIDPGYLTAAALIMATTKDFAHRIPLQNGIYAHLELLFLKKNVQTLGWTYPDFKTERYHSFFLDVRKSYLLQLRQS